MINFRYHVVTLVAVFLALGLGVLFGASFIDQKTVAGLQRSQARLGQRNAMLRSEVIALQKRQETLRSFTLASRDLLIRGTLSERPVVVVAFESSDDTLLRDIEDTLIKAGAAVRASIRLSDDLDLRTEERQRRVGAALQIPADGGTVSEAVVKGLADSLSGQERGYVQRLMDAGLASVSQPPGSRPQAAVELSDPGNAIVILPPGTQDAAPRNLLLPLVRALSAASVSTAVAQAERAPMGAVLEIREEDDLKVVTVDHADQPMGQAALVLGLQAAFAGNFGHYGTLEGSTALLPPPQSLPG